MELYRISGLAASALLLTAPLCIASAADMPLKAPPAAPPPVYSWTGFYVGGNAGVGWNRGNTDVNPLPNAATFVNLLQQTLNTNPRGAFAGGQIGANWQIGSVVVGAEFDWQGANVQGTVTQTPIIQNNGTPFPGAGFININQKIDSFGTARLRVG